MHGSFSWVGTWNVSSSSFSFACQRKVWHYARGSSSSVPTSPAGMGLLPVHHRLSIHPASVGKGLPTLWSNSCQFLPARRGSSAVLLFLSHVDRESPELRRCTHSIRMPYWYSNIPPLHGFACIQVEVRNQQIEAP